MHSHKPFFVKSLGLTLTTLAALSFTSQARSECCDKVKKIKTKVDRLEAKAVESTTKKVLIRGKIERDVLLTKKRDRSKSFPGSSRSSSDLDILGKAKVDNWNFGANVKLIFKPNGDTGQDRISLYNTHLLLSRKNLGTLRFGQIGLSNGIEYRTPNFFKSLSFSARHSYESNGDVFEAGANFSRAINKVLVKGSVFGEKNDVSNPQVNSGLKFYNYGVNCSVILPFSLSKKKGTGPSADLTLTRRKLRGMNIPKGKFLKLKVGYKDFFSKVGSTAFYLSYVDTTGIRVATLPFEYDFDFYEDEYGDDDFGPAGFDEDFADGEFFDDEGFDDYGFDDYDLDAEYDDISEELDDFLDPDDPIDIIVANSSRTKVYGASFIQNIRRTAASFFVKYRHAKFNNPSATTQMKDVNMGLVGFSVRF